jgi:CRISPR/Cas system type I-B associated protein Csh2 (Cas7 group RAMP superfamily)
MLSNMHNAYIVAAEIFTASGDKTEQRFRSLCDAYAKTYGIMNSQQHAADTSRAWGFVRKQMRLNKV